MSVITISMELSETVGRVREGVSGLGQMLVGDSSLALACTITLERPKQAQYGFAWLHDTRNKQRYWWLHCHHFAPQMHGLRVPNCNT
jgi:hypothetical protein